MPNPVLLYLVPQTGEPANRDQKENKGEAREQEDTEHCTGWQGTRREGTRGQGTEGQGTEGQGTGGQGTGEQGTEGQGTGGQCT